MTIKGERLTPVAWWRISLAGLFLAGTLVAQNFGDWSPPANLGATINTISGEQ